MEGQASKWDFRELRDRYDRLCERAGYVDPMLQAFMEAQWGGADAVAVAKQQSDQKPKPRPQALSTMHSKLRDALRE